MTEEISRVRVANPFDYYADIGQFVMVYGLVEAMLKQVLRSKADIEPKIALAVLSGVRADASCALIRRCYAARGEPVPPQVEKLLVQFALITSFRNDLLHHGIDFTTDPPMSSNRESVLHVSAVREHMIEKDTLSGATEDCGWILLGLSTILTAEHMTGDAAERAMANLKDAAERTWRYKPPAQGNKGQPPRPTKVPHQSRRHPPQSSQD